MKILNIVALAIIGVSFAMVIRPYRPELAMITAVVTSLIIILYIIADLSGIVTSLRELAERYSVNTEIIGVLIKVVGIAYLAQIGSKICADAGESAIAAKVEICGRILILAAAMPTLVATLGAASSLLNSLTP